jgi:hypothetical protein
MEERIMPKGRFPNTFTIGGPTAYRDFVEQSTAPASPGAGNARVWIDDDGFLHAVDSSGNPIGLDLGGGYLLNDQTTTNMMSKGTVYRFDGVNDYVQVPHDASYSPTDGDFSVSFYMYPENITGDHSIIHKNSGWAVGSNTAGFSIGIENGKVNCYIRNGTSGYRGLTSSAVVEVDEWYSVVVVRTVSSGGSIAIYVNGVEETLGFTGSGTADADITNTDAMRFAFDNTASRSFSGELSGVKVFNHALTASEVKDLISGNIPFKWQYGSQTNIITPNAGFESDTGSPPTAGNWANNGNHTGTAVADGTAPEGSNTCEVVATGTGGEGSNFFQWANFGASDLEIGQEYRLTFWAKNISGDTALNVGYNDNLGDFDQSFTLTAGWVQYEIIGQVDVADGNRDLFFYSDATATFRLDLVELVALGAVALYDQTSITANNWFDLANGNTGAVTGASVLQPNAVSTDEDNIPLFSVTSGITADTGSAQGNGVLTSSINQIATCANAGDAVTLPAAKPGKVLWIVNDGANSADVFPASGDNIDEAGANAAKALAADAEMQFICTSAGHWSTITSA